MTKCLGREAISAQGNMVRAQLLAAILRNGAATVQDLSQRVRYKAQYVDSLLRSGYTITGYRFVQTGTVAGRVLWGVEKLQPEPEPANTTMQLLTEIAELTKVVSAACQAGQPAPAQQAISLVLQKRDELSVLIKEAGR